MAPEATPPESKAMAVNICGQNKVRERAKAYPGMRNHQMLAPVLTRNMAMATATPTPSDRVPSIRRLRI